MGYSGTQPSTSVLPLCRLVLDDDYLTKIVHVRCSSVEMINEATDRESTVP